MKAIIFDMDGLMIDSERLYFQAEREIAWTFGRDALDETLRKMMGRNPIEGMEILVRELELPISPREAMSMRDDLMRQKMRTGLKAMPGLTYIIEAFYGRLKLAISTGARKEFLDIAVPSEYTHMQDFRSAHFIASDLEEAASHIEALIRSGHY